MSADSLAAAVLEAAESPETPPKLPPHPDVVAFVEALTPKEAAFLADFLASYTGPPRWVLVEATAAYLRVWMRERAATGRPANGEGGR
jgi:hypothetical protein